MCSSENSRSEETLKQEIEELKETIESLSKELDSLKESYDERSKRSKKLEREMKRKLDEKEKIINDYIAKLHQKEKEIEHLGNQISANTTEYVVIIENTQERAEDDIPLHDHILPASDVSTGVMY